MSVACAQSADQTADARGPKAEHDSSVSCRGVKVGDNSESVLSRNQPVCLAVVAVDSETGRRIWNISPLLSEDFLVTTASPVECISSLPLVG